MSIDVRSLSPAVLSPAKPTDRPHTKNHFVELYDDDAALVEAVARFVAIGLGDGSASVVVATPAHRGALEDALRQSVDLDAARARGLLVSLDAEETLALFMEDGVLDAARFDDVIGRVIDEASAGGNDVRVFGEMVALLLAQGDASAALALEDLWNDLGERRAFRLFCAYPTSAFGPDDLSPVSAVCGRHSHVLVRAAAA